MIEKKPDGSYKKSLYILGLSYWLLLILIGTPTCATGYIYIGFGTFWGVFLLIACPISYYVSGVGPK